MKYARLWVAVAVVFVGNLSDAIIAAESPAATGSAWVRRFGQIAKISEGRLEDFKKLTSHPSDEVQTLLRSHGFLSQRTFVKDLSPNAHYAFRFVEYAGNQLTHDMRRLAEEPQYSKWRQDVEKCLETPWSDMEEVFYWAGRTGTNVPAADVQYYGQVVGLRPDMADAYKLLHANPWPGVLAKITEGNIRNYAIFWTTQDSKLYLLAYFEYVGKNFDSDMAAVDSDPVTKAWMKFTDAACQLPIETRKPGEWWAAMDEMTTSTVAK